MADLLFIGLMVGFFALCVALIRFCDRIIGPDDDVIIAASHDATLEAAEDAVAS